MNCFALFLFLPETQYYRNYITGTQQTSGDTKEMVTSDTTADVTPIPKKTFLQELQPWSKINPKTSYIHLFFRPAPLIVYPAVMFGFLVFSTTLAWVVSVLNVQASIFQGPHYHMKPGINSLINIPAIIGIAFGSYVGGALTDFIAAKMAKRNEGIFEPEFRLLSLIFPFFILPSGLLMYFLAIRTHDRFGFGVQRLESWSVSWIGYGCLAFGLSAVPAIVMTYGTFLLFGF